MSINTFRLVTLGRLDLLNASGAQADPSLSARRRKIALLVVLASVRRPVSKDALVEMFWGEQDEARARHSLSDALSHLRRVLGRSSIVANQATAALDPSAPLAIDFSEFTLAVKNGDDARAIDLYGGPFLDGVHVDGSNSFEQWVSSERNRLSSLLSRAAEGRSRALLAHENWESAAEVSRKWLDADLSSSGAAKARLAAIAGPGTRESAVRALQEFERISSRLQSELGIRPETEVAALARSFSERIRQDEVPAGHTAEFAVPEMAPTVVASDASREVVAGSRRTSDTKPTPTAAYAVAPLATPAPSATAPTPRRTVAAKVAVIALVASLLIAIVAGLLYIDRNTPEARASTRTAIALTDFDFVGGDSTQRWMAEGLRTMLASRLSRSVAIELISPERVREISRRANYPVNELLGTERSREVGLQAGADWIVSGAVSRADTAYLLELTVRDVRTGRVLRVASVVSGNTLALTDAAAAKLLDVIDPEGSGAHLSELETSSPEAYQHFVAFERYANGISHVIARAELDKALALDSGFISAIIQRRRIAYETGDSVLKRRLDTLYKKHEARATFWDRTTLEAERIMALGEVGRATAYYRELVARYPRDPRAYTKLWNNLTLSGEWKEAEQIALKQLAIDSLAATAGTGVCAPCGAYSDLTFTRLALGDGVGAEAAARRLLELQPDLAGGWSTMAIVLLANRKFDEGLDAYRRVRAINSEDTLGWTHSQARHLIIANRLSDADTLIRVLEQSKDSAMRDNGFDVRALWYREQGKWADALRQLDLQDRNGGDKRQIQLMRANTYGRMGDYASARREVEAMHALYRNDPRGDYARWFSWSHTLLGDALASSGDTAALKVLADSALLVGSNSYYARDKMVPHFLRALVAVRGGRDEEAEREFKAAMFSRNGFTRVNVEYARLMLRQKRYKEAYDILEDALTGPLDAMLRYQPRFEILALMDTVKIRTR